MSKQYIFINDDLSVKKKLEVIRWCYKDYNQQKREGKPNCGFIRELRWVFQGIYDVYFSLLKNA
jgi:hypothetical protein